MKKARKQFVVLICGYGVPNNILKDINYNLYLTVCVNKLFSTHRYDSGYIILSGGKTDCFKPYRRTEAGEMKKWIKKKIIQIEKATKEKLSWKIILDKKALTTVENLLFLKQFINKTTKIKPIIFFEYSRTDKIRKLVKTIFQDKTELYPIDFDGSSIRYCGLYSNDLNKQIIALELLAAKDKKALMTLQHFAQKKLSIMRQYSSKQAHKKLPEILEALHKEYSIKK
ncbi:MAG: hypothetical protein ABIH21_01990 [Patescibacteria group bacterium]